MTITIEPNKDYVLTKIDYYYKIKKNYYAPSPKYNQKVH